MEKHSTCSANLLALPPVGGKVARMTTTTPTTTTIGATLLLLVVVIAIPAEASEKGKTML